MALSRKDGLFPLLGVVHGPLYEKQLEGQTVYHGSQTECAAHHVREVTATTVLRHWSPRVQSGSREQRMLALSCFSSLYSIQDFSPCNGATDIYLIEMIHHGCLRRLFPEVILDPVKLTLLTITNPPLVNST